MGKELPLACEEEEGQSVLLASTGTGESSSASSSRDKRTKASATAKGHKRAKAKDTEAESQVRSKAERADASATKPARRKRCDKDRKQDRGDERKDRTARRSASELGITFPGSYCDWSNTTPHYWCATERVDRGVLYQCKLCFRYLWLPSHYLSTEALSEAMVRLGDNEGYCVILNRYRGAKILLAKMIYLRKLETETDDKVKFAKLADKVLSDKEYDRR